MSGILYWERSKFLLVDCSIVPDRPTSRRTYLKLRRMAPPYCTICSYRQVEGPLRAVYHRHFSAREVRIMAGVEYTSSNYSYMCPTCLVVHSNWTDCGLNVVLSDSQLHEVHRPRDPGVLCDPDPFHLDWNTISGGTIGDMTHAFTVDYERQPKPMRIFVSAGLNDILQGASRLQRYSGGEVYVPQ